MRKRSISVTESDDPTPDTAMASGSDAGSAGGHIGPADLSPDEERLLAALERDVTHPVVSPEESLAAALAADDEVPLPGQGGVPDDGLNPLFRSPEDA
jgi:hypothetical protein